MVEPIKPSEMVQFIPDWVIKAANECISKHWVELEKRSHFTQDELMVFVMAHAPMDVKRKDVYDNHWLDIEPVYRKVGWKVVYDKPAYCENYPANFTFEPNND